MSSTVEAGAVAARKRRPADWRRLWLFLLGLPKTLRFNFACLPFAQAIRLPVFVSHRVWLKDLSGTLRVTGCGTGSIRIGFGDVGIFDRERSRTIWQAPGRVVFTGPADIGHGSRIAVAGTLVVGRRLTIAAESSIVAQNGVHIGDDVLISWDVLIIDTDAHGVYDAADRRVNADGPVHIGNSVWLGCRSLVLKGVRLADGVVVAAASTVTRSVDTPNVIVAGSPARVVKENIRWKR